MNARTGQGTALVAAGSQCQIQAMEVLKNAGATAGIPPAAKASECSRSALVEVIKEHAMNTKACQQASAKADVGNHTRLWDVVSILKKMAPGASDDCRGLISRSRSSFEPP